MSKLFFYIKNIYQLH